MSEPASPREQALIEAGDRLRDDLAVMRSDEILEGPIAMLLGDVEADLDRWDAAAGAIEPVLVSAPRPLDSPYQPLGPFELASLDAGDELEAPGLWARLQELEPVPRWLIGGLALSTIASTLWALVS